MISDGAIQVAPAVWSMMATRLPTLPDAPELGIETRVQKQQPLAMGGGIGIVAR